MACSVGSSWVWLNVSRTKRSADNCYKGDTKYKPVQEGNHIAILCAFLLELAFARKLQAVLENPPVSYMWKFPPTGIVLGAVGHELAHCHLPSLCLRGVPEFQVQVAFRKKVQAGGHRCLDTGGGLGDPASALAESIRF